MNSSLPNAKIDEEEVHVAVQQIIPYAFAKKFGVFLEQTEQQVELFCLSKPAFSVISEINRRVAGKQFSVTILPKIEFGKRLRAKYESSSEGAANSVAENLDESLDLERLVEDVPEVADLLDQNAEAPIIRLINALITQAVKEGVSDIHLEVFEGVSSVRYRVDGMLREVLTLKRELHNSVMSRLKVMSKLDIAEKRLPQDGRMSLKLGDYPIDVRVSVLPTQHGERAVLRLLEKQSTRLNLTKLGMPKGLLSQFTQLINKPHGILLVTGPTGSGKTTTLYSALNELDRERLNILTVEDPVEYDLEHVGQTQINQRIGLTFAKGLRSILRQDPDIVLVGEIRDVETAQIAIQASLTGHLVLSTLHTNTAIGAVTRLVDMGVESYLLSSSLIGVLSQRLVRTLCQECCTMRDIQSEELVLIENCGTAGVKQLPQAIGCEKCNFIGFKGRVGVYELIQFDEQLKRLIYTQASEQEVQEYAHQSNDSIFKSGVQLLNDRITTLDELLRVTQS